MKNKIQNCGKSTLIFSKEGQYYAKVKRCKEWGCHFCGEKKRAQLLDTINYYQEELCMNNMLTLTTCASSDTLDKQFKKIIDYMSLFNYRRFVSKHRGDKRKYDNYISNMIKEETYYIWLLESKVEVNGKTYIPRVHYAILLFDTLKGGTLKEFFSIRGIKKHFGKYYEIFNKKYSMYNRYVDLRKNDRLAYMFYIDYMPLFKLIYSTIRKEDYAAYNQIARSRIEYNINRNRDERFELSYIRIIEKTKRGRIHYHILTNFFVPHSILARTSTIDTFSSDQTNFNTILESDNNIESSIGEYLVKYLTKDVASEEDFDEDSDNQKATKRLITCSQNISLKLRSDEDLGFKFISEVPGTCEKEFMLIEEDIFDFSRRIINNSSHVTPYYKARKDIFDLVSVKKKELEDEFKEQYLQEHEYFDSSDYKHQKNEYVKSKILEIKESSQKTINEMDYKYLIDKELYQRRDSQTIIECSTYYDSALDQFQNQFINLALTTKGTIALLGGAGTGKSHCIASLVKGIPKDRNVLVCAYTGKAVSRLYEIIGDYTSNITISTIHKACDSLWSNYTYFRNNQYNPLPYDVCIVDEISMVDVFLFNCLLNALNVNCKIVVVGDFEQLEPCENGTLESVLDSSVQSPIISGNNNIMYGNYVTTMHLKRNYRSGNAINQLAYGFLGKYEKDIFEKFDMDRVLNLIKNEGYQVLCNINKICRDINRKLTKDFPIRGCNGYNYQIGQQIMFLRNDSQRGFYNGLCGIITDYNEEKNIIIIDGVIEIEHWETKILIQPTYAITIHKSQGSEIDKVILVLANCDNLLNSKVAYTGVTRVKEQILLMKEDGVDEKKLYKCK